MKKNLGIVIFIAALAGCDHHNNNVIAAPPLHCSTCPAGHFCVESCN
jgi:nitrous oxide reductase accessory protein NosL